MGEFPSGQRGQTVNLLRIASMVRIRPPPPEKDQSFWIGLFLLCGRIRKAALGKCPVDTCNRRGPAAAGRIRPLPTFPFRMGLFLMAFLGSRTTHAEIRFFHTMLCLGR